MRPAWLRDTRRRLLQLERARRPLAPAAPPRHRVLSSTRPPAAGGRPAGRPAPRPPGSAAGAAVPVLKQEPSGPPTEELGQPPLLLPPLNGLAPQVAASSRRHRADRDLSWRNLSHRCLRGELPPHTVVECLQWWTRQRPIRRGSTRITWELLGVLRRCAAGDGRDAALALPLRTVLNSVLDQWRLALQEGLPVAMTVKDALDVVTEWGPLLPSGAADEEVQRTYSLLLSALSVTQEDRGLLDRIHRAMPMSPSVVTMNGILTVWAKSKSSDAYQEARKVLESMHNPNEISYACLLEALHNANQSHQSIDEAEVVLTEMQRRGIVPNSVCYLHYLRILCSGGRLHQAMETLNDLIQKYRLSMNRRDDDPHVIVPSRHLFSAVMSVFARRGDYGRVKELLQELQALYSHTPREQDRELLMPTAATLNSVLEALANARTVESAWEAEAVLERLESWAAEHHAATACLPDTTSYNTVLDAWAEVARSYPDAVSQAEKLLVRMLNHSHAKPDAYSYTTVMKAWSRSNHADAPERCQAYLDAMWEAYEQERRVVLKPNAVAYATAMYAWSRVAHKRSEAPFRSEALLRDMKQRRENGDSTLQPTESIFVSLITTWNRSITPQTRREALARSQFYFDQMRAQYESGNESMRPTNKVYNALLEGMKQAGDGKGAERILKYMMDDYFRHGNERSRPNSYTFHSVMTAWARSRSPYAPLRAEAILRQMEDLFEQRGWDCKPTSVGFSAVLNCWAKSGREEAPARAEAILRHMEKLSDSGRHDLKPNMYAYATVLDAWARSSLQTAPERALSLFQELKERFERGDPSCRPSAAAYLALMSTWGRSSRPDGALKALAILNEMQDLYCADSTNNERPECLHFSAVINAFAERGDEKNAGAVLERIVCSEVVRPHAACYNGYIKAIIRSGHGDAGQKAAMVLRSMQEPHSVVRPDVVTFTSCISAWEGSLAEDAVVKAQALLQECIAQAGNKSAAPNSSTFLAFLRVLAKSGVNDKDHRARWVKEQMAALGLKLTPSISQELDKYRIVSARS